jgi:hypothetical protein
MFGLGPGGVTCVSAAALHHHDPDSALVLQQPDNLRQRKYTSRLHQLNSHPASCMCAFRAAADLKSCIMFLLPDCCTAGVAEGAVPKGNTPWERVISVCNFNSEALSKDPFKEMSRFKQVLIAAKTSNISVNA